MKKTLLFAAVCLLLAGCEQSISDGKVPEKYQGLAKPYMGSFSGEFEGHQMDLSLSMQADRTVVLTVKDLNGRSELVKNCSSKIGQLIGISGDSDKQKLEMARFDFDGKACGLVGSSLQVSIDDKNHLELDIEKSGHWEIEPCLLSSEKPQSAPIDKYHEPVCHTSHVYVIDSWLTGKFVRK